MAPDSANSTDRELSRLEALPTEVRISPSTAYKETEARLTVQVLEKQLEQLPISSLLRTMSVSRRLAAVASNTLRMFFQVALNDLQNQRIKVLLAFAPPAFVDLTVRFAYIETDDDANDITTLYSRFRPEPLPPHLASAPSKFSSEDMTIHSGTE